VPAVVVDTVGVAVPLLEASGSHLVRPERRVRLPGGGFAATGVGDVLWVEGSLPKRRSGENVEGLPLADAADVVREMVDEAAAVVGVRLGSVREVDADGVVRVVSPANPKIVRLDLVRDFQLSDPKLLSVVLDGLASVPQNGQAKVRRYADGKSGHAETLRVGPGSWAATLYDKHVETGGLAEKGRVRAEFRLRSRQLRSSRARRLGATIEALEDLDEKRGEQLRRAWWDLVGFGSWVGHRRSVWDALGETSMSDRERIFFVGWYAARRDRQELAVSDKTERKFRGVLRALELGGSGSCRVRLNYESGSEEVAA